jgi:hypothetical protein
VFATRDEQNLFSELVLFLLLGNLPASLEPATCTRRALRRANPTPSHKYAAVVRGAFLNRISQVRASACGKRRI